MLVNVRISADDLRDDLSEDGAFELIVELDKLYASWDLTEKLYEHFSELHKECLKEFEEDSVD